MNVNMPEGIKLNIVMNPPYSGNLHLKILDKMSKDFPDAEIVNLSPIGWLEDPLAKDKKSAFNKFADLRKKIENVDVVSITDAKNIFRAQLSQDLGIYCLSKTGGWDSETFTKKYQSFVSKIFQNTKHWSDVAESNKVDGIRVKIQRLRPHSAGASAVASGKEAEFVPKFAYKLMYEKSPNIFIDGKSDGIWWTECLGAKNQYSKNIGDPLVDSIKFDTLEEAQNFEAFAKTKFMTFCNRVSKVGVNTDFSFLPFMPTYKHPWTDEMLYKHFNLTPKEISIIEEEMK